jgi:uroporphyrinogen decarboxylase
MDNVLRPKGWQPDFRHLEQVLKKQRPDRPVFFDFIIGADKERFLTGEHYRQETEFDRVVTTIRAFHSAGYDHSPIIVRGLSFPRLSDQSHADVQTKSLNFGAMITDRASFEAYSWPEISECDFSIIDQASTYLEGNVKFIPFSFDGILENTIGITGYENLCYMLYDDPDLVGDIFREVGSRIKTYYAHCLEYDDVGAILCNDDWGFNSQTMVPPDVLRRYVFPWYREIVAMAHRKGKYAILHSCGYYGDIIDDIIDDMKFDGRHSYEDKIQNVEAAYQAYHGRIAIMGGIDVDYLARSSQKDVYERSKNILLSAQAYGGYALGSGNSVPDYITNENFAAMLQAAYDMGVQS